MGRVKTVYGYQYKEKDGICEITAKAKINPYNIERILGKTKVKGRKKEYEYVEIKSDIDNFFGTVLIERKDFNFKIMEHFIEYHYGGVRSSEHHPYYNDLKDYELLDDLGINVLTYKHYYPSGEKLLTHFCTVRKDDITEELKEELREKTREAEEQMECYLKRNEEHRQKTLYFEPL